MFSRIKLLKITIISIFVFSILSSASVSGQNQSKYGGTLLFATLVEPLNLDPGVIIDSETAQVANNIFETLVKYDSRNKKFIPVLATSWKVSPDRKKWTFYLRKGVRFHDGTYFNAAAVKFSWERQMQIDHPYHNPGYGRFIFYRSIWGGYPGNIKRIRVINAHTLQVELYARSYRFLKVISNLPFAVVSPKAVISRGSSFTRNPVGTGPFRFVEWRTWHRIVLERNPNYWGKSPYLDQLVFEPTPGEQSRHRQIRRGHIDMMEQPNTELLSLIRIGRVKHLRLQRLAGTNFSFISLNCQKPPLDVALVRKALCFAINRKRILEKLDPGMSLATSPLDELWGENIAGRSYPYNPGTARALLRKAGYPNGFKLKLWYLKNSRPFLLSPQRIAEEITDDLERVGIKVELKGLKWETYLEKLRYGEHQAAITGMVGIDHIPGLYYQACWGRNNAALGGTNFSFYRNTEIQNLLFRANLSNSSDFKLNSFKRIQEIISNDAALIPLYHNRTTLVINKRVMNVQADKDSLIDFSRVWLKK